MADPRTFTFGVLLVISAGCAGPAKQPPTSPPPHEQAEPAEPSSAVDGVKRELSPAAREAAARFREGQTPNSIARMVGYWPNTVLTTHRNEKVKFYDDLVEGKCVLINFMYTKCDGI